MPELLTEFEKPCGDMRDDVAKRLRAMAIRGLVRMYRPDDHLFAFRLRRQGAGDLLEGQSRRYTAITLIGLAREGETVRSEILHGDSVHAVCGRLLDVVGAVENMGDVALILWAAAALGHERIGGARDRLLEMCPWDGSHPTVELAWAVTALSVDPAERVDRGQGARLAAERLMSSFARSSGLFPHWPPGAGRSIVRSHVCCFADLVYPIQALAHFHARTADPEARELACQCAARTCALQGPAGQWWWHFDVRTGRTIEEYPVYAVHQDAMAPMALFDLHDACGTDHRSSVERGLRWLLEPPELNGSLVDPDADVIWRKVARHEPHKLSRTIQALASRVHPSLRVPGAKALWRPGAVDHECRPYHLGWLLYAWSGRRKRT